MPRETVALRDVAARRALLTTGGVRLMATVVAALLASVSDHPGGSVAWLAGAAALGGIAIAQDSTSPLWRAAVTAELVAVSLAIPLTGGYRSPLLPYLLGPVFAVGFRGGARLVAAAGVLVSLLLASGLRLESARGTARDYVAAVVQWVVLAVAFGLLAAWARSMLFTVGPRTQYEQVSRLLAELRGVARRLPGTLDPLSTGETLLDACAEVTAFERAAVLLAGSNERLTPLLVRGAERLDLDTSTQGDGPVAQAWSIGQAVREVGRDVRSGMASLLVVPVTAPTGCTGVVVLESVAAEAFPQNVVRQVGALVADAAPRLESALLFDEIRRLATVEERQRVAREIHDGIAQDLVYIGYELDGLRAELDHGKPTAKDTVRRVREHVTRVVGELRLSIFTLRTAPEPGGLGAALGEYVHSVATPAGIAVHLVLSEDATRLPADAEAELLRIAQEAVTNARKHAKARNLWVTLEVDPPRALLRVEDDGEGIAANGRSGFGLEIMRERAERLGATLHVRGREPRGTAVEVAIGGSDG